MTPGCCVLDIFGHGSVEASMLKPVAEVAVMRQLYGCTSDYNSVGHPPNDKQWPFAAHFRDRPFRRQTAQQRLDALKLP